MTEIFLTKGIGNERDLDGYIDEKVAEIKAVPDGEPFRMLITSYGGDTAQGDRIDRAVREHNGETEAMIIGAAASMAMNILPAFDKRYSDPDADLMIHKARFIDEQGKAVPMKELSSDQQNTMKKNSAKMFARYSAIGVAEDFLEEVYLSEDMNDHYLTPAEAQELGILEVKPVESESELNLAADHSKYKLTSELNNNMGLFKKEKKPVRQMAYLEDGGMVSFMAVEDKIDKGVTLEAIGTDEPLGDSIVLKGGLKASLNSEGEVVAMEEEEPKAVVSDEAFAAMETRVADLEAALMVIQEAMGAGEEAAEEEVAAKAEEDKKMEEVKAAAAVVSASAKEVLEAASTISTSAKLEKVNENSEPVFSGMTAEQERIAAMNKIAKGIKLQ